MSGRYTFDLAFENVIQCSVVSHPSLLKVPDDLEVIHIVRRRVFPSEPTLSRRTLPNHKRLS
jgi:hypothetical protein